MAKKHTFTIGEYTAEGRTKTDARARALAWADNALAGSYAPDVETWRGVGMLVWRTPMGWYCRHLDTTCFQGVYETREEARQAIALSAAQLAYDPRSSTDHVHPWAESVRGQHESWCAWQRRYAEAIDAGRSCDDAREFANTAASGLARGGRISASEIAKRVTGGEQANQAAARRAHP